MSGYMYVFVHVFNMNKFFVMKLGQWEVRTESTMGSKIEMVKH